MSGLLLAIDPYIARLNNGVNQGYFGPINTTKMEIGQSGSERVDRVSALRTSYGQALDSYSRPNPTEIALTIDEAAPDIISMAMLGVPATYAQSAVSAQAQDFTAEHDRWVSLPHNHLTAFAITGKVDGTDYLVDLRAGLVYVLSTGTIADQSTVSSTYDAEGRSGSKVAAGTDTVIQVAIKGAGTNLFNSRSVDIEVFQANITPSGPLSFISPDPVALEFSGVVIKLASKTGVYEYVETVAT